MDRVGIYLRISDDRDGNQTATERQEEDCRKFAESKSWTVADVFEDVDLSAYKRNVKRPEFERMLGALRNGEIDGVLAWKIDRITRRQRDFVRLDEQCEDVGAFIATVVDQIDTRTGTGRFVAELLVAQARMESENSSIRVKRAHEAAAKRGDPSRGGWRPFGLTADRQVVPEEAELLREAARRIFAGERIRGIAFDWERREITTPAGKPWREGNLRKALMGAVLSGQREYEGTMVPGTWPAIFTPETTAKLRVALASKRTNSTSVREPRKLLLGGGLARCGRCGGRLVGRPREDGARRYVCSRNPGRPNCGRLGRLADPVDEVVTRAVFAALDGADLADYMRTSTAVGPQDDDLAAIIREDEDALEQLSRDHYVEKAITRAEYFAARDGLQARLEQNRARMARRIEGGMLHQVAGAGHEVEKRWATATFEWKRAVLSAVIDHVLIMPVGKGSHTFDANSIVPMWKF
jgi:DNA invertase Pin-like site-specific DNA recombinase